MSQHPRQRIAALLLSLIPGWGHVHWGRELLGLALFTLGAVSAFALINGLFIYEGKGRDVLVYGAAASTGVIFVGTWVELFFRTSPARVERERRAHEQLIRQGTIAYLKGDFQNAEILFRECLRIEPQDIEGSFRLGMTFARAGNGKQARRWLRKTLRLDVEEKWRWEASRELLRLDKEARSADQPERKKTEKTERQPA